MPAVLSHEELVSAFEPATRIENSSSHRIRVANSHIARMAPKGIAKPIEYRCDYLR